MADGDCAPIDVELVAIEAEFALAGKNLGAKGFVDFDPIDIRQTQASRLQQRLNCRDGRDAHDLWRHADYGSGYDSYQRFFLTRT